MSEEIWSFGSSAWIPYEDTSDNEPDETGEEREYRLGVMTVISGLVPFFIDSIRNQRMRRNVRNRRRDSDQGSRVNRRRRVTRGSDSSHTTNSTNSTNSIMSVDLDGPELTSIVHHLLIEFYDDEDSEELENLITPMLESFNIEKNKRNDNIIIDVDTEFFDQKSHSKYDSCVICSEKYTNADIVSNLQCGHIYHFTCITEWGYYNPVCPLCKSSIDVL